MNLEFEVRGLDSNFFDITGINTEAGNDKCYVKFGAVKTNLDTQNNFMNLLNACEELAITKGLSVLTGGVNAGRYKAYQSMISQNFSIDFLGVSLHRPNNDAYNIGDRYVIDDWR